MNPQNLNIMKRVDPLGSKMIAGIVIFMTPVFGLMTHLTLGTISTRASLYTGAVLALTLVYLHEHKDWNRNLRKKLRKMKSYLAQK
ncbi:MAG: hypothetical protein ACI83D_000675 [Planctomycetota bacterium]|jgi:hypothetical protein